MENLLNIKSNRRHSTLEYLIKKYDASQDMSRSAVFEREVRAAQGVKNWKDIQISLSNMDIVEEAPIFTSLHAKYGDETAEMLDAIRCDMLEQLTDTLKVLQAQYMVLLLQANYLEKLKQERISLKADKIEEAIDMPEMSKIFCKMMLTDKDCNELLEIRKILVNWRNK